MEKKDITKFPKGFFQLKRPTITTSEALKDVIPFEWKESKGNNKKQITKLVKKRANFYKRRNTFYGIV